MFPFLAPWTQVCLRGDHLVVSGLGLVGVNQAFRPCHIPGMKTCFTLAQQSRAGCWRVEPRVVSWSLAVSSRGSRSSCRPNTCVATLSFHFFLKPYPFFFFFAWRMVERPGSRSYHRREAANAL